MKIDQSRSGTIGPALVKKAKASSSSSATKRIKFIENSNCGGKVDSEKKKVKNRISEKKSRSSSDDGYRHF